MFSRLRKKGDVLTTSEVECLVEAKPPILD
jgi:hypothetical protein